MTGAAEGAPEIRAPCQTGSPDAIYRVTGRALNPVEGD